MSRPFDPVLRFLMLNPKLKERLCERLGKWRETIEMIEALGFDVSDSKNFLAQIEKLCIGQ